MLDEGLDSQGERTGVEAGQVGGEPNIAAHHAIKHEPVMPGAFVQVSLQTACAARPMCSNAPRIPAMSEVSASPLPSSKTS